MKNLIKFLMVLLVVLFINNKSYFQVPSSVTYVHFPQQNNPTLTKPLPDLIMYGQQKTGLNLETIYISVVNSGIISSVPIMTVEINRNSIGTTINYSVPTPRINSSISSQTYTPQEARVPNWVKERSPALQKLNQYRKMSE